MNYITSCPACETQFLLTKAHLKAYRGKVQCGHCQHIFNAKNRLTEVADDSLEESQHQAEHQTEQSPSTRNIDEIANVNVLITNENAPLNDASSATAISANQYESDELTDSQSVEDKTSTNKPIKQRLNGVLENVPNLSDLASAEQLSNLPYVEGPYVDDYVPISDEAFVLDDDISAPIIIEDLTNEPAFTKTKFNYKNSLLPLAVMLLLILALLQTVYFNRTLIAAQYPVFKPMLIQACQWIQCDINLPKQLALLSIDDSDMQESDDYKDVINFSSMLINNANYNQTYPNIELTLTDTEDEPVLRRIVKPEEYLKNTDDIVAGIGAHAEQRLNIAINVRDIAVAGYRVLVVY